MSTSNFSTSTSIHADWANKTFSLVPSQRQAKFVHLIKQAEEGKSVEWNDDSRSGFEFNKVQLSPDTLVNASEIVQILCSTRICMCFIIDNFSQFDTQLLFCCRFVYATDMRHEILELFQVKRLEKPRETVKGGGDVTVERIKFDYTSFEILLTFFPVVFPFVFRPSFLSLREMNDILASCCY